MTQLTPMGAVFLGTAVLALPFAWLAWRQRGAAGRLPLAAFFLALSSSQAFYALGIGTVDVELRFLWYRLYLLTVTAMPLAWVAAALELSGRDRWLNRYSLGLLAGIPAVAAVVAFLPWTTELVATAPSAATVGALDGFEPGPVRLLLGLVGLVALVLASGIYLQLFVRTRHISRTKAVAILTAAVTPWLNIIFLAIGFFPRYDISGPLLLLAGGLLTLALVRSKTVDPVPAAHESVVQRMGNGVVILDADGRIHELNPSARSMLGVDAGATPAGDHIADWFDEWGQIDAAATTEWQQLSVDRDGRRRYLEVRTDTITDYQDDDVGRMVELTDVTERETHERALARFQTIFTTVDDPVYVLDGEGRFELVNDSFVDLVGYGAEDLTGNPFGMVLADGEALPEHGEAVERAVETATGERIPVETTRKPIETRFEGLVGGSVGSVRDISERRRVESALSKTTERYETLVDASPLAIVAFDTDGRVERWNPAAEEMFGWSAAAVDGAELPIVPESGLERAQRVSDRVFDGERKVNVEFVLERADGSRFDASVSLAPMFDDSRIVGAVAIIADVSEQKARERALERQNDRLDEFAEVVSHDLRNPLSVADGYVQMARETGDVDHLDEVVEAHDRIEEIVDDVLSLARDGADIDDPVPVSLAETVDEAWSTTASGSISLEQGELGTVEGDPSRLRSLFENLFRNVGDHCPDGTTVTVGSLPDRHGFFVADDGPGMSADERQRAFESGYTTAEEGTGIGLSTVKTIADAHDWSVRVVESDSGGTRFEFETGPFGERRDEAGDRSLSE